MFLIPTVGSAASVKLTETVVVELETDASPASLVVSFYLQGSVLGFVEFEVGADEVTPQVIDGGLRYAAPASLIGLVPAELVDGLQWSARVDATDADAPVAMTYFAVDGGLGSLLYSPEAELPKGDFSGEAVWMVVPHAPAAKLVKTVKKVLGVVGGLL